jgi:hypothetical protein
MNRGPNRLADVLLSEVVTFIKFATTGDSSY